MPEPNAAPASQTSHPPTPTGTQHLQAALAAGPAELQKQVRFVLALSQLNGVQAKPATTAPEPLLSTRQARMTALVAMADALDAAQIVTLEQDIRAMHEASVRLPLLARLAPRLLPERYPLLVRDIWRELKLVTDPAAQARICYTLVPLLTLLHSEPQKPSALLRVLASVQRVRNTDARLRGLLALLPRLSQVEAFNTAKRILDDLVASRNDVLCAKTLVGLADHLPEALIQRALALADGIKSYAEKAEALTALARYVGPVLQQKLREDALDAIDTIEDEDARANALIAFIPNLEYADPDSQFPALLEKALTITIMLNRRHIRAQALVALAPHLTPDLQGEALAAVHGLPNERERATLLAQLAPTLPPDMLVASLAVAHTMRAKDARVQALSILSRYVPTSAHNQTTLDAFAAATNLDNPAERIRALVDLVDILPDHLQAQAMTNALESLRDIGNANARARALNLLSGHVAPDLLDDMLELIREFNDPAQRINGLLGVMRAVPEPRLDAIQDELLQQALQVSLEYKRARAFISIAPYLSPDKLHQLEGATSKLDDPVDRVAVYIAIAQHLPPTQRAPVIGKAWAQIKRIDDGYDSASALASIAPFLPTSAQNDLSEMVCRAVEAVQDEYDKASAVSLVVPLLQAEMPAQPDYPDSLTALEQGLEAALQVQASTERYALLAEGATLWVGQTDEKRSYALWQRLAPQIASLPMPDAILCLAAVSPLLGAFSGQSGLREVAYLLGVR